MRSQPTQYGASGGPPNAEAMNLKNQIIACNSDKKSPMGRFHCLKVGNLIIFAQLPFTVESGSGLRPIPRQGQIS